MNQKLWKLWKRSNKQGNLKFRGSMKEFDAWKQDWYDNVPMCRKFRCLHDSMSCGMHRACGDSSSYNWQHTHGCQMICEDINCSSCFNFSNCSEAGEPHLMKKFLKRFDRRMPKELKKKIEEWFFAMQI